MKLSYLGAIAVAAAATAYVGSASAIPIDISFNVNASGVFTSNSGTLTTAATITTGAPNTAAAILANNVGLVSGQTVLLSPEPMGVNIGNVFFKSFDTPLGSFLETLTVTARNPTLNALGVLAVGMITQTAYISGPTFDPTPVFWSAAYTQNAATPFQINGSFNNTTTNPDIPEPASLALVGIALAGLGFGARRRAAKSAV
jgi:hypothetical protein